MSEFEWHNPVRLVFGCGKLAQVGTVAKQYGSKALIVTSSSSARTGRLDKVVEWLKQAGLGVVVYDKIKANPLTTMAHEAAALARNEKCDLVIGLGGGSPMDAAKATAFMAVNDGDVLHKGQIVAVLENNDLLAQVDQARASVLHAQAALERLQNGARPEERAASRAAMNEAQAAADNALEEYQRSQRLFQEGGIISQSVKDHAERDSKVAQARLKLRPVEKMARKVPSGIPLTTVSSPLAMKKAIKVRPFCGPSRTTTSLPVVFFTAIRCSPPVRRNRMSPV